MSLLIGATLIPVFPQRMGTCPRQIITKYFIKYG